MLDLKSSGRAARTRVNYGIAARSFVGFAGDDPACLNRRAIRQWVAHLAQDRKPGTVKLRFSSLRVFCNWLVGEGILPESPMKGMSPPAVRAAPVQPYTAAEVARLLATCDPRPGASGYAVKKANRDRAMLMLLISTGMRLSELTGITVDRLDMEHCRVAILGKGQRWRVVPFDHDTYLAIRRYLRGRPRQAGSGALFVSRRGVPATADCVDNMLRERGKRAGVPDCRAHRFRHSFATNWLAAGGSEGNLQELAGWTGPAMMMRYTAARRSELAMGEYRALTRRSGRG